MSMNFIIPNLIGYLLLWQEISGEYRSRTDDLLRARQAL